MIDFPCRCGPSTFWNLVKWSRVGYSGPTLLDPVTAARAHVHRDRAWRNGRGRSKAAAQRLARHLEVCPWC